MPAQVFVDPSVLDLLAAHVLGSRPVPPDDEWAVDDLRFMLERFAGQLHFQVPDRLDEGRRAALGRLGSEFQVTHSAEVPEVPAGAVEQVRALGVPAHRAPWVAAAAARRIRLFLQAEPPDDGLRDRVIRACDLYLVDPMNCLSHLHARLMGRSSLSPGVETP